MAIDSSRPIFIVGAPRSGTTLMQNVLDAHSNVICPRCETFLFTRSRWIFEGRIWDDHYSKLPIGREGVVAWFRESMTDLFRRLQPNTSARRFCEKTPEHAKHMDLIHEVFPDAQFIHIVRNGEDVVRSLQKIEWSASGLYGAARNTFIWMNWVRSARSTGARLGPNLYMEIRYEELITNPRKVLEEICAFLGEQFDQRMLEFYKPENSTWGLSSRPFPNISETGPLTGGLNPLYRLIFRLMAGNLMRELGYYH